MAAPAPRLTAPYHVLPRGLPRLNFWSCTTVSKFPYRASQTPGLARASKLGSPNTSRVVLLKWNCCKLCVTWLSQLPPSQCHGFGISDACVLCSPSIFAILLQSSRAESMERFRSLSIQDFYTYSSLKYRHAVFGGPCRTPSSLEGRLARRSKRRPSKVSSRGRGRSKNIRLPARDPQHLMPLAPKNSHWTRELHQRPAQSRTLSLLQVLVCISPRLPGLAACHERGPWQGLRA
jgi:hypothetical protein